MALLTTLSRYWTDLPNASLPSNSSLQANYPIETHAFFSGLTIEKLRSTILSGLVVAETKSHYMKLKDDIPQVILEMHGYAEALELAPSLPIWFAP